MSKTIYLFLLLSGVLSSSVYASTENSSKADIGNSIAQLFFSLFMVLILIYILFWLMKKKNKFSGTNLYNHLGGLPLGQNKSIQTIEIGNKIYILGVGQDIKLINIVENEEDIDAIKNSVKVEANSNLFNELTTRFIKKNNSSTSRFERELAEKIEQLKHKRAQSVNKLLDDYEGEKQQHE